MKPILEVLVGKTVEQALLEVMEEEELANLNAQQRAFEELRNAELVETQRLEEQERRHREEKVNIAKINKCIYVSPKMPVKVFWTHCVVKLKLHRSVIFNATHLGWAVTIIINSKSHVVFILIISVETLNI